MNVKMDDLEGKIKNDMEVFKEGLEKLLQEILPGDDKVFHETHDENKRNVNHDCRDSNFGLKTHHIPKIYMRKLCGYLFLVETTCCAPSQRKYVRESSHKQIMENVRFKISRNPLV